MKVSVEHEIPNDPVYCRDPDSGGWYTVCRYHKMRDKTGTVQRALPRCILFEEWLDCAGAYGKSVKCERCLDAMKEGKAK